RGLGLSDRTVDDFALEALVSDVVAVVDAAGADRVAVFACLNAAPVGIAYAARCPDRVSHLVLWCAVARMEHGLSSQLATLLEIADKDWDLFTEAAAHAMVGWSAGEAAHRYAEFFRACVTPENARALVAALRTSDVRERLPHVRVPTLVLHRRGV